MLGLAPVEIFWFTHCTHPTLTLFNPCPLPLHASRTPCSLPVRTHLIPCPHPVQSVTELCSSIGGAIRIGTTGLPHSYDNLLTVAPNFCASIAPWPRR